MHSGVLSLSRNQLMEPPSPFCFFSNLFPQIDDSALPTLQKAFTFLLVKIQIYILISQADFVGVQNGLIDT